MERGTLADVYEAMGQGLPAKYPLYGRDAHRTRAGVHADGLNKFWNFFQNTPSIAQPWFLVGQSIRSRTSISQSSEKLTTVTACNNSFVREIWSAKYTYQSSKSFLPVAYQSVLPN